MKISLPALLFFFLSSITYAETLQTQLLDARRRAQTATPSNAGLVCASMRTTGVGALVYSININELQNLRGFQRSQPNNSGRCREIDLQTITERHPCVSNLIQEALTQAKLRQAENRPNTRYQIYFRNNGVSDFISYNQGQSLTYNYVGNQINSLLGRQGQCPLDVSLTTLRTEDAVLQVVSEEKISIPTDSSSGETNTEDNAI